MVSAEKEAKKKEFKGLKVVEALAATGLRSVRYIKEIPSISRLVANDLLKTATDLMQKNFEFNNCD
jgi:tRNA (guanine26-N2/guanine27-N2)-dimethyltransferase